MKLTDAITFTRALTRSKTQGNWTDAHVSAYLVSAHARANLLLIKCDKSRGLATASIVGTGAELYNLPSDHIKPCRLFDSNNVDYYQCAFNQRDLYTDFAYYIKGAQIGIKANPETGTTLTYDYYQTPTVWSLENESSLPMTAQYWACCEAACDCLGDRADANYNVIRDIQSRYQRDLIAECRVEPTVQAFNKRMQFDENPYFRRMPRD